MQNLKTKYVLVVSVPNRKGFLIFYSGGLMEGSVDVKFCSHAELNKFFGDTSFIKEVDTSTVNLLIKLNVELKEVVCVKTISKSIINHIIDEIYYKWCNKDYGLVRDKLRFYLEKRYVKAGMKEQIEKKSNALVESLIRSSFFNDTVERWWKFFLSL